MLAAAPEIEHYSDGHFAAGSQNGLAWSRNAEALDQNGDENVTVHRVAKSDALQTTL